VDLFDRKKILMPKDLLVPKDPEQNTDRVPKKARNLQVIVLEEARIMVVPLETILETTLDPMPPLTTTLETILERTLAPMPPHVKVDLTMMSREMKVDLTMMTANLSNWK
jgi:hypothetical protein